jgi:hypothetical protein
MQILWIAGNSSLLSPGAARKLWLRLIFRAPYRCRHCNIRYENWYVGPHPQIEDDYGRSGILRFWTVSLFPDESISPPTFGSCRRYRSAAHYNRWLHAKWAVICYAAYTENNAEAGKIQCLSRAVKLLALFQSLSQFQGKRLI